MPYRLYRPVCMYSSKELLHFNVTKNYTQFEECLRHSNISSSTPFQISTPRIWLNLFEALTLYAHFHAFLLPPAIFSPHLPPLNALIFWFSDIQFDHMNHLKILYLGHSTLDISCQYRDMSPLFFLELPCYFRRSRIWPYQVHVSSYILPIACITCLW